ncbi:serine/threonine protein kinase [Pontiella sulfatireligans]|uniref:Serine/threonine-protein kinase PknD n=1 Tax=Pontiella sulfatireligans TaxID=2750658 RepID=A0A6C2UI00_9BACT|nr:serine/threonine-protein kinase [Pontiella sulfatireligans]VGO18846.1 Serine/threonine-protein kinase PknD [Pontiella sulfatireligans]
MHDDGPQDKKHADLLYDFFKHREDPLSDKEQNSLTPILNALKAPEARYASSNFMAEGGEKRIFRVYDQYLNRHVALAQPVATETITDQERFLREGQLTANLTHPNIVPIHNMGIGADGTPFFTMELIPGDSLEDIIANRKKGDPDYTVPYDQKALLSIFNKVCDAVAYAHSRTVIHLDIKPDNIRVGQFGEVLLCDWGLALVEEHVESGEAELGQLDGDILNDMTLTGTVKGTPGFMAPEQILNMEKTHLSDIYALGAILYYMITFQLPVNGESSIERMENTRDGKLVPIRKRKTQDTAPPGLAAIAMKALSYKPDDRYENVQALQSDLDRFLKGYPTDAEPFNIFNWALMLILRHRNLTTWLLISLVLLSVVMGFDNQMIKKEKQTAETNLSLFIQEQEKSGKMYDKLTSLSLASQGVRGYTDAKAMIKLSDQILAQTEDPEIRNTLLRHKADLHFVLQQFNLACESFEQLPALNKKAERLLKLSRQYSKTKPDDNALLSESDLAQLIVTLPAVSFGKAIYLFYYHTGTKPDIDPKEHIKPVGAMLARLNDVKPNRVPNLKLTETPEGFHLDLSNTPYGIYLIKLPSVERLNVLEFLQLNSLDLSHASVALTQEFQGIKVKELRLTGTIIAPKGNLRRTLKEMGVKEVTLGKDDYPSSLVDSIRKSDIKVIEEEYSTQEPE